METYIVVAIVCGILGYLICEGDNKPMGAILGFLLGPIGLIIAVITDAGSNKK